MMIAALVLGIGLMFGAILVTAHAVEQRAWRRRTRAFRLYLPSHLTVEETARWFGSLAATTHPPRFSLFPLPPIVLEVLATERGITHHLLVDDASRDTLLASLRATLPGARLEEAPDYLAGPTPATAVGEFTLTSQLRPLAVERAASVSTTLLATLQPLDAGEAILLQLIVTSGGTPDPVASQSVKDHGPLPWWLEGHAPADADATYAQRAKQREPLLAATLRLGATAASRQRAQELLARVAGMPQGLNTPGALLVRRVLPSGLIRWRLRVRDFPIIAWPLMLSVREVTGLAAWPYDVHLPGLTLGRARQLPPSPDLPATGNVVGISNYPGMDGQLLALADSDRLRHVHLIGPTGSGKSTLVARMALQDIADGDGVVVVDPKGDLISDIAARIPPERHADVVVLDPSEAQAMVVGFNPLRSAADDEASRELIADQVVGIFHSIYEEFWGPRTDEILRACLFSLTHVPAPDGTAFTLVDVPELLTNPTLRRYVTSHQALPPYLRSFWQWFDGSVSEGDRTQSIGPVLNKLRAFSMRSNVRLMLGQSQGIPLDEQFLRRSIILVSLAKGKLGGEVANLLGALFVSALWQATQSSIHLPPERRRPFFAYLDEFQDVVRVGAGTDLADMLAQARGLGLSLTLAHQYLSQLPATVREATLSTVRTHVAFQLEWDDARSLEARFAPLTRDDLSGLSTHEFAMKPCVNGQTLAPVTGVTLPLDEPTQDSDALARASRERYGVARAEVEAGLLARLAVGGPKPGDRFGREAKGRRQ